MLRNRSRPDDLDRATSEGLAIRLDNANHWGGFKQRNE
jgi:hypothetical protein